MALSFLSFSDCRVSPADFIVVLLLSPGRWVTCGLNYLDGRSFFALSPVSLMISGFHGNTDSVMTMFLVCTRPTNAGKGSRGYADCFWH